MELKSLAIAAAESPGKIRKLWRSGPENRPPEWPVEIRTGPDGRAYVDEPYSILARAAGEFGESFLVLDIAEAGACAMQKVTPSSSPLINKVLSQLGHARALALLRTGSIASGYDLLHELYERDTQDLEIGAALARTWKDMAFLAEDPAVRHANLLESHKLYLAGYHSSNSPFLGINASATAIWLGKTEQANQLAESVAALTGRLLARDPGDYWATATLAECHVVQRRQDEALKFYSQARSLIDQTRKWANLDSTRKQARRLCDALGLDFSSFESVFRFPEVMVFSGHMFDSVDRPVPRFPASLEAQVRAGLRQRLQSLNPGFGVSAAACGSDFLFIEEMLDLGADVRVILPWPKDDFIRSSVDLKPGAGWEERFKSLLSRVTSVTYLSQQTQPKATRLGYRYLNDCISGLALMGARLLNAKLVPMAVWDGLPGDGEGGTSNFVSFWEEKGYAVEVVGLPSSRSSQPVPAAVEEPKQKAPAYEPVTVSRGHETIKTILFADVLGYTKIPAKELEFFPTRFLAKISTLLDQAPQRPILTNTWGDAIYLVFDDVIAAGQFAIMLRDLVQQTDWAAEGLSTKLNLRISLHTGPVLLCVDPIVRHMTITGSHVSHAARIEPKVNPGEIWTSESFAAQSAIAALQRPPGYELDYLGQIELAKNYGSYSLFRLRSHFKSSRQAA